MTPETHQISESFVEKTWLDIGDSEDENVIVELSQNFSETQPSLAEFVLASTEDLSDDAMELAFYIGFVVWRCYAGFFESSLKEVSADQIIELAEAMEESITDAEPEGEEALIENQAIFASQQKHVWQYIVDAVLEEDEEISLSKDEQASLLTTLKIHMDCLTAAVQISVN